MSNVERIHPDGRWNMTANTPMGPRDGSLELSSDGDELQGTLVGPMGKEDLANGRIDGNTLTWIVHAKQPIPMEIPFTATIDGDELTGEAQLGAMGTMTISGRRVT